MTQETEMIVSGARCSWWDTKDKVATTATGLPCCPRCGGVLFEHEPERWWAGVDSFETDRVADYRAFIDWMRGRCYPNYDKAVDAYLALATP